MGGEGMALLRGPLGRGALCAATTSGRLAMVDVRAKPRVGVATQLRGHGSTSTSRY